jgi:hypothetical protein
VNTAAVDNMLEQESVRLFYSKQHPPDGCGAPALHGRRPSK